MPVSPETWILAVAAVAALAALPRLRSRLAALEAELADERLRRLSELRRLEESLSAALGRLEELGERVGPGPRVTASKRRRALDLLARGFAPAAVAGRVELRENEVRLLARLAAPAERPRAA
jgi:hypothetical protein